jgi:hypothetical protein
MRSKKQCISLACRLFAFHSQTSDIRHLHWVPHEFSDSQKASQVELSIELRDVLLSIRHQGQNEDTSERLTSHQSCFYLSADHEMIWLRDGDEVPDRGKYVIQSQKLMLAFVWNPHAFQVVDPMSWQGMPKRETFTAAYYI